MFIRLGHFSKIIIGSSGRDRELSQNCQAFQDCGLSLSITVKELQFITYYICMEDIISKIVVLFVCFFARFFFFAFLGNNVLLPFFPNKSNMIKKWANLISISFYVLSENISFFLEVVKTTKRVFYV